MLGRLVRLIGDGGLGAASGALAGLASFVFLEALGAVTELRVEQGWLIWLLPLAGLVIGLATRWVGRRATGGTALAVGEARRYGGGAPALMAPFVLVGTLLGHLVGASVGREGTAVQMSSSITEAAARLGRLDRDRRAVLARAALGGGFGSVFGVPWAGLVFALEASRRPTLRTVVVATAASFIGHAVVVGRGHHHAVRPPLDLPIGPLLPVRLLVAGVLFGIAARLFHSGLTRVRRRFARHIGRPALRPALGGALTLGLALVVGRDALGLSLPLVDDALGGADLAWWTPWLKLLLTVLALGSGFVGGEVTPLFVVGATLGAVAAGTLGMSQAALGSIGLVSVFGAAARVPLTAAVMAAELFGGQALLPALAVTWVGRAVAGRRGLYDTEPDNGPDAR